MFNWIAVFQLPLLYLPLMAVGLGVWGSDLDEPAGRLFLGTFLALPLLDALVGRLWERVARGVVGTLLPLLGTLLAGAAYRPVHLGFWDERSAGQAALFCALGLVSWGVSRAGVARLREDGAGARPAFAAALVLLGACWLASTLYPLLPTLALGALFALLVVAWRSRTGEVSGEPRWTPPRTTSLLAFGALLVGLDLYLVVWDLRFEVAWAWQVGGALAAAGIGVLLGRRLGEAALWLGGASFLASVLWRPWVLEPAHAALVGLALGVLLARTVRRGSREGRGGRFPLGAWSGFWLVGVVLGLSLYQNLAFAGWRAVLLVPPLLLVVLARRRASTPAS